MTLKSVIENTIKTHCQQIAYHYGEFSHLQVFQREIIERIPEDKLKTWFEQPLYIMAKQNKESLLSLTYDIFQHLWQHNNDPAINHCKHSVISIINKAAELSMEPSLRSLISSFRFAPVDSKEESKAAPATRMEIPFQDQDGIVSAERQAQQILTELKSKAQQTNNCVGIIFSANYYQFKVTYQYQSSNDHQLPPSSKVNGNNQAAVIHQLLKLLEQDKNKYMRQRVRLIPIPTMEYRGESRCTVSHNLTFRTINVRIFDFCHIVEVMC